MAIRGTRPRAYGRSSGSLGEAAAGGAIGPSTRDPGLPCPGESCHAPCSEPVMRVSSEALYAGSERTDIGQTARRDL